MNVSNISSGGNNTCAITAIGGVKCWGSNSNSQLGDNSTTTRPAPVDVVGLGAGVASISVGYYHTCVVTTAGAVKCWGYNSNGQLGDGSTTQRSTPVDVVGLSAGVASVSVGDGHTCAMTTSGAAKCWGRNANGQLGDNSTTQRNTPVDVVGLDSGVSSLSAGYGHTCVVTGDGAAKCWGRNVNGQLGDNSTSQRNSPVAVAGLGSGVASIYASFSHTCAVTTSGAAKCWGDNNSGKLGDNSIAQRNTPVDVVGLSSGVSKISSSYHYSCAIMTSGAAKCWGANSTGQLGNNSTTQRSSPVDVLGLGSGVVNIAAGYYHACGMMTAGTAKCWGDNSIGQLGNNSTTSSNIPVDVLNIQ